MSGKHLYVVVRTLPHEDGAISEVVWATDPDDALRLFTPEVGEQYIVLSWGQWQDLRDRVQKRYEQVSL